MELQRPGAGIMIADSGHQITVRGEADPGDNALDRNCCASVSAKSMLNTGFAHGNPRNKQVVAYS